MPLQNIPQQNQPVGLQLLGDALMGGASDYAARRDQDRLRNLALQDEQRKRGYQLSDVASNRSYEQQQFDKLRNLQLSDEQRKRGEVQTDLEKKAILDARLRNLNEAARLGLFDITKIGDEIAEGYALQALSDKQRKDAAFDQQQPINAQARLAELGQAEQVISQKMAAVEARMSAEPAINQADVANTALQLATQANGGKQPSREQIQAALPEAMAKAQQEAQIRWYTDKSNAQVQYQILSSQLNTIRQQQANLTSTFKVAPMASPLVDVPAPAAPQDSASAGGNPLGGFTAALDAQLAARGMGGSPTATSNDGPTVQNITSALSVAPPAAGPVLRQSRTAMLADEYAKLDAPILSTESKLADANLKLSRLQSGLNPWEGETPIPFNPGPKAMGQYMTEAMLQQQALQRRLQQERAAKSAGKTSLLSGIAPMAPAPFSSATPSSMGSLLSSE